MAEEVLKYGGSSLSSHKSVNQAADNIIDHYLHSGSNVNVVVSAFGLDPDRKDKEAKKVTDLGLELVDAILNGASFKEAQRSMSGISEFHSNIYRRLSVDHRIISPQFKYLESLVFDTTRRIERGEDVDHTKLSDAIVSVGELSSTPIVAAVVNHKLDHMRRNLEDKLRAGALESAEKKILERLQLGKGAYTLAVEPGDVGFITDSEFTKASLLESSIDREIGKNHQSLRSKNRNTILFYPGFIAKDVKGGRTTLGRDGSNITATALGAAVDASKITIYTDTDGVLLVDPRIIRGSQTARNLSYIEVVTLAKYGGMNVLGYESLRHLIGKSIPVFVKNSFNPNDVGTTITHESHDTTSMMKGIGIMNDVYYREFTLRISGDYEAIQKVLQKHEGVAVIHSLLERSSNGMIGKYLIKADPKLKEKLKERFNWHFTGTLSEKIAANVYQNEMPQDSYDYGPATLVSIVGKKLGKSLADVSAVYGILASIDRESTQKIQHRLPFWKTDDSIHVVVRTDDSERVAHEIYNDLKKINIVLYGLGDVGRKFLHKVVEEYESKGLNVVGIVDRSGGYAKVGGFTASDLEEIISLKKDGKNLKMINRGKGNGTAYLTPGEARNYQNLRNFGKGDFVLVDATADPSMMHRQLHALNKEDMVISVNKTPYSLLLIDTGVEDAQEKARRKNYNSSVMINVPELLKAIFENRLFIRGTVGANIGIPDTLLDILEKTPEYVNIRGCLSGTLGYILTLIDAGRKLSEGVRGAIAGKLTEPEPFKDYSGRDVLNKAIILTRMLAIKYGRDPFDISIQHESFIDPAIQKYESMTKKTFVRNDLAALTKDEFAKRMEQLDGAFDALRDELKEGYVWRYIAEITYNAKAIKYSISVGLRQVHKDSPLGVLKGPDNRVLFGINRTTEDPQEIRAGAGAGLEATAQALMGDLQRASDILRGENEGRIISYEPRLPYRQQLRITRKLFGFQNPFSKIKHEVLQYSPLL